MNSPIDPPSAVPAVRIRRCSSHSVRAEGEYVLYWMTAARRLQSNFALQRALDWCDSLKRPLVIFEPLGCRGRWNNDRLHAFVMEGMRDQQAQCAQHKVTYLPYVEPRPGAAADVLRRLSSQAAVIVTDDFPCYVIPAMLDSFSRQTKVLLEAVDGNGLWPMHATEQVFTSAYSFRRFLQKQLAPHLSAGPQPDPIAKRSIRPLTPRLWQELVSFVQPADENFLAGTPGVLAGLPLDHSVCRAAFSGGATAAKRTLQVFLTRRLSRYADHRNDPDDEAASGLSPYLHFGHLGVHEVFEAVTRAEDWSPEHLAATTSGSKSGWWGLSPHAEAFLDEVITWRELGFNFCSHRTDYDQYASLPDWARKTLEKHTSDPRPVTYTKDRLEVAETHDDLWNAAQRQLAREGRMHNYLRMLWGKKVLEWSSCPAEALDTLIDLNNKYAVDGRDPNSYSGICWIFGRYDRPWGPERPIFGTIRYMSSQNTARKLPVKGYLDRYGPAQKAKTLFDEEPD